MLPFRPYKPPEIGGRRGRFRNGILVSLLDPDSTNSNSTNQLNDVPIGSLPQGWPWNALGALGGFPTNQIRQLACAWAPCWVRLSSLAVLGELEAARQGGGQGGASC
jgi:hypothetical protein